MSEQSRPRPLVALYVSVERAARALRRVLAVRWRLVTAPSWRSLFDVSPASPVVAVDPRSGTDWERRFASWAGSHPTRPLVSVVDPALAPDLRSRATGVRRVLSFPCPPRTVDVELRQARLEGWLLGLASHLRGDRTLDPTLREGLGHACVRSVPFPSVTRFAALCRRSPRTLHYHWRRSDLGGEGRPGLREFLDWLLLLRTLAHRIGAGSWERACRRIGLTTRRLRRTARRLVGVPPGQVTRTGSGTGSADASPG